MSDGTKYCSGISGTRTTFSLIRFGSRLAALPESELPVFELYAHIVQSGLTGSDDPVQSKRQEKLWVRGP